MSKIYATIYLSDLNEIHLELYKEVAPLTVLNFCKLAKSGYYNHTIFHRVIKNFMIQTGGYLLDGDTLKCLKDTPSIKGEFLQNGWDKNTLSHDIGVISMARTSDMNSATGQFFLCSAKDTFLDSAYAGFGKTIDEKSNEVILNISKMRTINIGGGFTDFLEEALEILKIEIEEKND